MPSGGLTLFHVRGIRIGVDFSWFFVLFLIILWLSGLYRDVLGAENEDSGPYLLALASALLFFGSILLHELGHAMVAMSRGIRISEITLWMFGGVARMERDSDSPATEFKIAVAGPLVTLAIVATAIGIGILASSPSEFEEALRFEDDSGVSGLLTMLGFLAEVNLFVLVFNLIPAYPLDGGRVARAIAWWRTGNRNTATRFAATLGQGFSYILIAVGVYLLIMGDVIGGIWLGVIGFILGQSARAAQVQTQVADKISGVTVADVMDSEPVAIPDEISIERALDEYFLRYRWPWFPVVDATHHFRGLIVREVADAVPEVSRADRTVADVFELDASGTLRVLDDAPLESLLGNDALRRLGGLAAVDAEGRLRGVITADQVGRALRDAISRRAAAGPPPPTPPPPPNAPQ